MIVPTTPSQTVGPYYAIGLAWPAGPEVVPAGTPGATELCGTVYDGCGAAVPDHVIETWQADAEGRFADMHGAGPDGPSHLERFRGFGRCGPETGDGRYRIVTVKPGRVPGPGGVLQAPHVDVSLFARGLLHRLVTRIYFADEQAANAEDPVLQSVPADRRASMLAVPDARGYRLDIHLQGPHETVFFAL